MSGKCIRENERLAIDIHALGHDYCHTLFTPLSALAPFTTIDLVHNMVHTSELKIVIDACIYMCAHTIELCH